MATITASKWGTSGYNGSVSFANTRGQSTGNYALVNNDTSSNRIMTSFFYSAGSKGSTWDLRRAFYAFDVSSYASGYTISNLKFYYVPTASGNGTCKVAIVKSTAQGNADTNLTNSDYDSFDDGVDYADNDGTDIWTDGTSLSYFDLNATAISAFTSSYLKLCVLEYSHDYQNLSPLSNTNISSYINASSTVPYLSFTATPTGYGNDVLGVSSSNIDSILAVSSANISKVIGV
tara:strand:+ start:820 stop:1518 length:699 start_codon:yes stop_codon:yes gene_type:complete